MTKFPQSQHIQLKLKTAAPSQPGLENKISLFTTQSVYHWDCPLCGDVHESVWEPPTEKKKRCENERV